MEKTDTSKIRLFYVPATADKPPTAIDFIRETEDGQLVSEIRVSTQAELSQEHGQEVKIIDLASFTVMRETAITTPPEQIAESEFIEALNILPPMRWGFFEGLESFRCSEFYSGNVTTIYARQPDGTCWKFRDNAYIHQSVIAEKVQAAAKKAAVPA